MTWIARARSSVLIVILALAFVGQLLASPAMAIQPAGDTAVMAGMAVSDLCSGCAGADHSRTAMPDCSGFACAGVVAILPAVVIGHASFPPVFPIAGDSGSRGIS